MYLLCKNNVHIILRHYYVVVRCKDTTASNNVELLEDTNVYGTVRTYKCIEGHKLVSGSLSRTCLETATYDSDPPQCERKSAVDT